MRNNLLSQGLPTLLEWLTPIQLMILSALLRLLNDWVSGRASFTTGVAAILSSRSRFGGYAWDWCGPGDRSRNGRGAPVEVPRSLMGLEPTGGRVHQTEGKHTNPDPITMSRLQALMWSPRVANVRRPHR